MRVRRYKVEAALRWLVLLLQTTHYTEIFKLMTKETRRIRRTPPPRANRAKATRVASTRRVAKL